MLSTTADLNLKSRERLEIPEKPAGVKLTVFENGLTLIVLEDHSAPVVSAQAWCMAGSIHEGKWMGGGLSHVLEHMLFKGTTTRGPSRIDQEIQDVGGYMNAYTSFDRTAYWINVPNTGARVAIDVLCDITCNATLPEDEMAKEKQVILREMDMNQDDPGRRSSRRLFEVAYTKSPYRYTIIGYPDIYNEITREDVVAYYKEKYVPNNLLFVVVGDIKTDEVEEQIRKAFSGVKARPLPPTVLPEEPPQTAPREIVEEAPIEMAHMHYSWHIPNIRHPDVPALDVLSTLLGAGRSSRLYQQVREKAGLVQSVDAWTYSPGNQGLLGMSAVLDSANLEAARAALLAEVEKMKTTPVPPEELSKAVKQFLAGHLSSRKTMQGQAQDLGANWTAANDLNFSERYLDAVRRLTPDDLTRVANLYLTPKNRTFFGLVPKGVAAKAGASAPAAVENAIQKFALSNGLRLLIKEDHRLPFVEFRFVFKGGVLAETPAKNGMTLLLAKMLLKGTKSRSAEQIATEIESVGGSIDAYGGNNSLGVNAEVMSCDFNLGLDLLADVLLNPAFPEAALDLEKQMQLAAIRSNKDHLLHSGSLAMRRALFGDAGYGLDVHGSEISVPGITAADVRAFHDKIIVPGNAVMAVYGDIQPQEAQEAVEKAFGAWTGLAKDALDAVPSKPLRGIERVTEVRDKKQAVLLIGFRGVNIQNPDHYALDLIQEACSDMGSRLFMRIRDKLGLAYYVGVQNFLGLQPGYFAFYAGTAPDKVELVEKEMLVEAGLLRSGGLTAEELKRCKAKLVGQKKIARQDLASYAMTTALDELYGLGYANTDLEDAKYEAVTQAQTMEVARKYLTPDAFVVALVKPAADAAGEE